MTKKIINIVIALLGISLVIFVHELGHYLTALSFEVPAPEFSIGFGPTIFSFHLGQTLFKISALPLGGYVNINNEILAQKPYLIKMIIILAGVFTNLIFSYFVWFFFILTKTTTIAPIISNIVPNSPAHEAGLQKGDHITHFNGTVINGQMPLLSRMIQNSIGKLVPLTIDRFGDTIVTNVKIEQHPQYPETGWLGVQFKTVKSQRQSILQALISAFKTFGVIFTLLIPTRKKDDESQRTIIGPIGIISIITQSIKYGLKYFMLILASISANIGVFNLFPLPFLDGGKALLYTIQTLYGKPIPENIILFIYQIFIILFIAFILYISFHDIKRRKK